jgi:hypothetical protein
MTVQEIQALADGFHYWDAAVIGLYCNYFADEIQLVYEQEKDIYIKYVFEGCYKSNFDHVKNYDKLRPVKEMTFPQIPYFMQEVTIGEVEEEGVSFYTCKINMFPLYLEIWCKDIKITSEKNHLT